MAYAKSVRTVKTCVGSQHCRFGLDDSMGTGIELEGMLEGLYTPAKVKLGVTGCPRNCAEAYIKDIGLVAIEGGWEVYVGGAGGTVVRKGDLLATVADKDAAIEVALTFLQYYREHADYKERSYTFMERLGLEAVQAVVFDPEEGPALRERFHLAQAATIKDPWLERRAPVVPNQFSELDTTPRCSNCPHPQREPGPMTIPAEIAAAATDLASSGWVLVGTVDDLPALEGRGRRSTAGRWRCSGCSTGSRRSMPSARTARGRCRMASSPTAASPARCTTGASISTPARCSAMPASRSPSTRCTSMAMTSGCGCR